MENMLMHNNSATLIGDVRTIVSDGLLANECIKWCVVFIRDRTCTSINNCAPFKQSSSDDRGGSYYILNPK